jgi:pSer/pThr/pTyr-binding forkhead associated (FHA) protein
MSPSAAPALTRFEAIGPIGPTDNNAINHGSDLAPGATLMPTLLALSVGHDIAVDHAVVMVGRSPLCDARLDSVRVSRRHCILAPEGGEVVVRDLGSANGTWINGRRVAVGRLKPGDELSIADIHYRLE